MALRRTAMTRQQGRRQGQQQWWLFWGGVLCGECPGQSLPHVRFVLLVVVVVVVIGGGGGGGGGGGCVG